MYPLCGCTERIFEGPETRETYFYEYEATEKEAWNLSSNASEWENRWVEVEEEQKS